jgi:HK97 family phage portal protein
MGLLSAVDAALGNVTPRLDNKIGTAYATQVPTENVGKGPYFSLAYLACELAKARPISVLPVNVYQSTDTGREEARDDPSFYLSNLLTGRCNALMKSADLQRWVLLTKDTLGQAYIRVQWGQSQKGVKVPKAIFPVYGEVTAAYSKSTGTVRYCVPGDYFTDAGWYGDDEIFVFRSPLSCCDGPQGRSLAAAAAETIKLSIDLEQFYDRLLSNGSHFPMWLESDEKLNANDIEDLKAQLKDGAGIVNAGRLRVFDKGLKVRNADMNMADISLVEQQTWILQQTCRITGVPPQEVYDLSHSTYSNSEQGSIQFAQKTLMPECRELELVYDQILRVAGLYDHHVKFDLNGMLRGEYESRMAGYQTGVLTGFFTNADVRKWEEMPYIPGTEKPLIPANYYQLDENGDVVVPGDTNAPAPDNSFPGGGAPIYEDMCSRVKRRASEKGDCDATREFAAKVLQPWASACAFAGIDYDIESDIERLVSHA